MDDIIQSTLMFVLIVEIILGCFGNGFIALVNCLDWVKRRQISAVNQLLTALAFSRISLLLTVLTVISVSVLYSDMEVTRRLIKLINFPLLFSNHFSMWFAACLSLFYFLKIANFSNTIFVYLKTRVNQVVSGTLLMSLALLFLNTLLINSYIDAKMGGYRGYLFNDFSSNNSAEFYRVILIINDGIFTSIPFTFSQLTFLLLIFSLWRHHKKMQQHGRRGRDAYANAHIKALKTMITHALLCAIFFLALLMQTWRTELMDIIYIRLCQIAAAAFPSGHSCVLILGNTKLRQAFLSVLWWMRCRLKNVHPKCF
ncbi:taste receptor type 2 member 129 [Phodopus roborovskii]|uniref:Taste receptor type 2 n=1 Tax=Phodopus roborovskii TaxID=109678 RepID=A0AAV0AB58_PHORO|nr:taste receptor type 2 member 129 [Phodopus roborovskii]CAH7426399.1 Tas2r129 [Phodopus roborovskii]